MSTEEKFQSTENISEHSLPTNDILILIDDAQVLLDKFLDSLDQSLNTTRRLRLNGIGISRYGFTNKVSDVASENMRFAPATFSDAELKALIRRIELLRNLSSLLRQCLRIVNDELLITGDEAYAMALLYYNTLREQARARVLGADEVFRMLEPFFRRHRRILSEEPTVHELERDLHALVHGHKDGRIVVERERPHLTGGKRVVIDEVAGGHAAEKVKINE